MKPCACLVCIVALAGCASHGSDIVMEQTVLVTFALQETASELPGGSQRTYHGGRWDSGLHTQQLIRDFAVTYDLDIADGWPIDSLGLYCVAFAVGPTADLSSTLTVLAKDPRVIHVQRNQTFRAMGASTDYDDPLFELQYGKYRTELVKLHRVTTGKDVRVGIVDSSVDLRHPDLDGQIDRHSRFLSGSGTLGLTHGTAVAGVIGAASNNGLGVVGLAPMADIHIFAACRNSFGNADTSTSCSSFALAKALEAAIEARIDVLNMSLAGPRDRLLTQLLDVALKRGMIVIAAENVEDEVHNFPASMDGVLGVDGRMGYWFTHPEHLTTQAGGGYQVFRGTSVSAAGLSGVAALLRTMLSHSETMEVLRQMTEVDCAKSSGIQQVVYGANACI